MSSKLCEEQARASSRNLQVLVCKYYVKKLREEAVNGNSDRLGMAVVRISMKGKQDVHVAPSGEASRVCVGICFTAIAVQHMK